MGVSNKVVLEEIFSIAPSLGSGSSHLMLDQTENDTPLVSDAIGLLLTNTGEFEFLEDGKEADPSETLTGEDVAHVFKARFDQNLTPSETRLLMQLIAGGTLPELSKQDGVSYGTRRNQLAAIRQKADRKRQSDVVVIIAVLCANYLRKFDARPDGAGREIVELFAQYYKNDFRLHRPTMSSGRELVVVDVGPLNGRKVLFMHPISLPFAPLPHDCAFLWESNIRVLSPIRPGYYGVPAKRAEVQQIMRDFCDDFVEFLKVIGAENAPIASHTYGIASAILIAQKLGTKSQRLIASSPRFHLENSEASPWGFSRAWKTMLTKQRGLTVPIITALAKPFTRSEYFIRGLEKAYRGHPEDLEVLKFGTTQPWFYATLRATATRNLGGLLMDIDAMSAPWITGLADLECSKEIWLSARDPFAGLNDVTDMLHSAGCQIRTFTDTSRNHFIYKSEALFEAALA